VTVNRGPLSPIAIEHSWHFWDQLRSARQIRSLQRPPLLARYSSYGSSYPSLTRAADNVLVLTHRLYSNDPCIPNSRPLAISFHYITSSTSVSELPNRVVLRRGRWKNIDEAHERERIGARCVNKFFSVPRREETVIDQCRLRTNVSCEYEYHFE